MGKSENGEAKDFVEVMRDVIRQELSNRDTTAVCIVESVNGDGTLNLYVLPDRQSVVRNIINQCRYDFNVGDTALLYLINNRLSNSFVIAKYNGKNTDAIDNCLSAKSLRPVQNKVITDALNAKQNKLIEGDGITISNNIISAQGFKTGNIILNASSWDGSNEYQYSFNGMSSSDVVLLKPIDRTNQQLVVSSNLFCTQAEDKLLFSVITKPVENITLSYAWKEK